MYPSITQNRLCIRPQRSTVIWLLAAVILAYAGLFQHQIAHQLDGDDIHCAQCLAADHFGHAPLVDISSLPVVPRHDRPQLFAAVLFIAVSVSYFSARAPPSLSHI